MIATSPQLITYKSLGAELESKGWLLGDYDEWFTFVKQIKLWEKIDRCKIVIRHDPDL